MVRENIEHTWTIICGNAIIDQETNNVSLINLIEQMTIQTNKETLEKHESENKPFIIPNGFTLVTRFKKKGDLEKALEVDAQYEVTSPSGKTLHTAEQSFEMAAGIRNYRLKLAFNQFPVTESGTYEFIVSVKGKTDDQYTIIGRSTLDLFIKATG